MQFQLELNNMDATFFYPVVKELSEQIASELLISDSLKIVNKTDNNQRLSRRGGISNRASIGYTAEDYSIDVIAVEEINPDKLSQAGLDRRLNPAVFLDKKSKARLNPTYVESTIKLSITVRSRSRSESEHILSRIRTMIGRGTEARLTSVQYSYLIPTPALDTLAELWKIKEKDDTDTETMAEWTKRCWANNFTIITDPSGTGVSPAIRENQTDVLGHYLYRDGSTVGEKELSGMADLTFEYEATVNRPHSLTVYYPAIINQKPVPKALRVDLGLSYSNGDNRMGELTGRLRTLYDGTEAEFGMLRYPSYDDWTPMNYPTWSIPIISNVVVVDPADPTLIGSMKEYPNFTFSDQVLAYLGETREDMSIPNNNLFYLALYRDDGILTGGVTLDEDLVLRSNYPMDTTSSYHMVIFVTACPNQMPESKRYIPMIYPDLVERYLKGLNIGSSDFPTKLTKRDLVEWWEYLNKRYLHYPNDRTYIYCPMMFSITSSVKGD